jgi:DNA-binding beta-propeller fold protein YncE
MVIDESTGKLLGEIAGLSAAHGVALDYTTGHGFATSGRDSTVVMFDLRTLNVLGRATAADDADAILYDPASKLVFTFNGDANSSSVIDPASGKRVGTIPLGGKPEYGVSGGDGKIYANIEDKSEVVEIDARAQRVTRRWSLAPCQSPTGLAIDVAHGRLFSGCGNRLMAISDATTGRLVKTLPIGAGVDATAYDAGTQNAFASNGDGTLTVIHEDSPSAFRVVETVQTMRGARTMALDPRSHRVYVVSAQFGPTPATATADNPRRRPPIVPGSFTVLELSR